MGAVGKAPLVIAAFDDGFELTHPALRAHLVAGMRFPLADKTDHGTKVAGVLAGAESACKSGAPVTAAGVAKVMTIDGVAGSEHMLERFEKAVDFVVARKRAGVNVRIVNASFGREETNPANRRRWLVAVQKLATADILLVCATANWQVSTKDDFPSATGLANVITVARRDGDRIESASDPLRVDIAAEAVACTTTSGGGTGDFSGTSAATPRVAASAARLWALHPEWTAVRVKKELLARAQHRPALDTFVRGGKAL